MDPTPEDWAQIADVIQVYSTPHEKKKMAVYNLIIKYANNINNNDEKKKNNDKNNSNDNNDDNYNNVNNNVKNGKMMIIMILILFFVQCDLSNYLITLLMLLPLTIVESFHTLNLTLQNVD